MRPEGLLWQKEIQKNGSLAESLFLQETKEQEKGVMIVSIVRVNIPMAMEGT